MSRSLYLDFEFSRVTEPKLNLVSCVTFDDKKNETKRWWLHNDTREQEKLKKYLNSFEIFIAYSVVAEARCFITLGLDPLNYKWIDQFLEYRMLTNHNDQLSYGKQLVNGKVKFIKKPKNKWERSNDDEEVGFKPTHSLAEASYKLTGAIRDTKEKDELRGLIISDPPQFSKKQKERILHYNEQDVIHLPEIQNRFYEEMEILLKSNYDKSQYLKESVVRGRYSAHTAWMESDGYPINYEATLNFSKQVGNILFELQKEINELFPDIQPFKFSTRNSTYTWDQIKTRKWLEENCNTKTWIKTEKGQLSLSLEAFEKVFPYRHNYPKNNFGAQMVRFLKMKQSLYGFSATKGGKRKNFFDSVGSDKRVRPYMNHYGAQSSRSQPAASGFMFLKPAWMRALVLPEKGRFMAGIDYGQQEFFLAALLSDDRTMIEAYLSGDPYLYGAKLAGAIPKNGTKETHKAERELFKNTYLGILYGMTKIGLSIKLSNDMGKKIDEDFAEEQIQIFNSTFPDYINYKKLILSEYKASGYIKLPCGWYMFGNNENDRSVQNVPVQGFGGSIMRKAVDIARSKGCQISYTLHDAIYIEDKVGREDKIVKLYQSMVEAFKYYFPYKQKSLAMKIKLDPFAWSPNYKRDSEIKVEGLTVPCSDLYIDGRAQEDYDKFSKYFKPSLAEYI